MHLHNNFTQTHEPARSQAQSACRFSRKQHIIIELNLNNESTCSTSVVGRTLTPIIIRVVSLTTLVLVSIVITVITETATAPLVPATVVSVWEQTKT